MSETGDLPQFQSEASLEEGKLRDAVTTLTEQFESQFATSTLRKKAKPQIVDAPYLIGGFMTSTDPRILVYAPPTEFPEYKDELSWKIDRSEENVLKIVRGSGNIEETVIIKKSDAPGLSYRLEDKRYDKKLPEHPPRQSQNTNVAVHEAKEIIASIPQVKR